MRLFIFIIQFSTLSSLAGQIVDIPDPNFLKALIGLGIDTNSDSLIQISEIISITELTIDHRLITNLKGIEEFRNLESLNCGDNNLSFLDVSKNSSLLYLACYDNNLTDLKLNQGLLILSCTQNEFTSARFLSQAPSLESLDISNAFLDTLDLRFNHKLEKLKCNNNKLIELYLKECPMLKELECALNRLQEIDLSGNELLERCQCSSNLVLRDLHLNSNAPLERLYCVFNILTELELKHYSKLEILSCYGNRFTELDLRSNPMLVNLLCGENMLTELDLSQNPALESLECEDNMISELYLNIHSELILLSAELNNLSCLDLSNNINLKTVRINDNFNLENLYVANFENMDVSSTNLKYICAPQNLWSRFNEDDIANAILTENCPLIECEGLHKVTGKFFAEIDNCEFNDLIEFTNLKFKVLTDQDSFVLTSNKINSFEFYLPGDQIRITPFLSNPNVIQFDPPSYNFELTSDLDSLDFCFSSGAIEKSDLEVVLYTANQPRPGFNHAFFIQITNLGNINNSGSVEFKFDSEYMQFQSSDDDWILTNDVLILDIENLRPLESKTSKLFLELNTPMDNPPLIGGEDLCTEVSVMTSMSDSQLSNNHSKLSELVVNSFDPNDKTCLTGDFVLKNSNSNCMTYRIRFENSGTASALNITVTDSIDVDVFDINSAKVISASHPVQMQMLDELLIFDFFEINLPFEDAINDGYVLFDIYLNEGLERDVEIRNEADIFFDFNWPIRTNTTESILVEDVDQDGFHHLEDCDDLDSLINPIAIEIPNNGIDEDCDGMDLITAVHELGSINLSIYPNPARSVIYLSYDEGLDLQSTLYDLNGQRILSEKNTNQINVKALPSGTYLLEVKDDKSGQRVIEKISIIR